MPEVKSVRDIVNGFASNYVSTGYDGNDDSVDMLDIGWSEALNKLIQSDRRAIIEKCKEAIGRQLLEFEDIDDRQLYFNRGINAAIRILDSAFSEIEGGK